MALLLLLSVVSWTYIFRKVFALRAARSQTEQFERSFWAGGNLPALSVLWLRLMLQICGYLRMIRHPDAQPVGVPKLITIESQVKDEIADALGMYATLLDDPERINRDLELALAVTAPQVQEAARLFAASNRIVLWFLPEAADGAATGEEQG